MQPVLPPPDGQVSEPVFTPVTAQVPMMAEEAVRAMQEAFQTSRTTPHWPMYLRNVKQFIKNSQPTFDEHRYGFHSFLEAVRSGQKAGLFRLERNRQGILRVFPGSQMPQSQRFLEPRMEEAPMVQESLKPFDIQDELNEQAAEPEAAVFSPPEEIPAESQPETEQAVLESASPAEEAKEEKPVRKRRISSGIKRKTVAPRRTAITATTKRTTKKAAPPPEEGSAP
jgi:hypothetical protein